MTLWIRKNGRKQHFANPLCQTVSPREIAREIIIPAAGNHKLDFVARSQNLKIGHVESARLTGVGTLDVHYFDDLSWQSADEPFAARLDHHSISGCKELLGKRGRFGLQQGLTSRNLQKASGSRKIS